MNLSNFDIIIINTSGGKDSISAIWEILRMAKEQSYPKENITLSHQDLGKSEWPGSLELIQKQSEFFGLKTEITRRRNFEGKEETLLEYALRRGKWPSNMQRWCTSDFKRGPGSRVVTSLTKGKKDCKVLHVFGFRASESPARKKKDPFKLDKRLSNKSRTVYEFLPIHDKSSKEVWEIILDNNIPYPKAYDYGMPRYSCVFCIFSPFEALVIAGTKNPELLDEYIEVEDKTGHTFQNGTSLREVKEAIENGYKPKSVPNWVM